MKSILKNKSGVAIELALTMLVFVFALCSVILVITKTTWVSKKQTLKIHNIYAELDEIGEKFVEDSSVDALDEYDYYCEIDGNTLIVKKQEGGNALLKVEKDGTEIKKWIYYPEE